MSRAVRRAVYGIFTAHTEITDAVDPGFIVIPVCTGQFLI